MVHEVGVVGLEPKAVRLTLPQIFHGANNLMSVNSCGEDSFSPQLQGIRKHAALCEDRVSSLQGAARGYGDRVILQESRDPR